MKAKLGKWLGRLGGLIAQNFWWKMLALVIAVAIWGIVASEPELSTFTTVRVEYRNAPDDLELASEPVSTVMLELSGPSGELRGAGEKLSPSVVLDMSNAHAGENTYTIGDGNVKLGRGVRLQRAIPPAVRFRFEPRRIRTVPVVVRYVGEGQNGYQVAQADVRPHDVQVVGPRSRVARIAGASTDQVDVSNTVGTEEFHVNLMVDDPFVRVEGSPEVVVRVTMKKK